jgi:hypothetical protein
MTDEQMRTETEDPVRRLRAMIKYIEEVNPDEAAKLNALLDKKEELIEKGNRYGERFTDRQYHMWVDPIVETALLRCRILERLREKPYSAKDLGEELGIRPGDALWHVTALRRKNLAAVDRIEERTPLYTALT